MGRFSDLVEGSVPVSPKGMGLLCVARVIHFLFPLLRRCLLGQNLGPLCMFSGSRATCRVRPCESLWTPPWSMRFSRLLRRGIHGRLRGAHGCPSAGLSCRAMVVSLHSWPTPERALAIFAVYWYGRGAPPSIRSGTTRSLTHGRT